MRASITSLRETVQSKLMLGRARFATGWSKVRSWKEQAAGSCQRWNAILWQKIYAIQHAFLIWRIRYRTITITILLILLIIVSSYEGALLQRLLASYFAKDKMLSELRMFFVTLGGALLGAAAIAFSLVMFAIQVNVERMPHGLFRKLNSDYKLLGAFAIIFILAITIAVLSLIPDTSWLTVAALTTWWGLVLILALFVYAYNRALSLINPSQQLNLMLRDAQRNLHAWACRAHRAAPLFPDPELQDEREESQLQPSHDLKLSAYYKINPHWTASAQRAILYAISFSRRYAEQGDHEVSRIALSTVVAINAAYVEAKGKTFFSNNGLFDTPLESDGFINDTLEHLRQNVKIGICRGDEQQIEQTLRAMTALCQVFINIDYGITYPSKTHANLAIAYLSSAAQSLLPHGMPDVLMEAVRLLGQTGQLVLRKGYRNDIVTISEKIGLISCTGVVTEDYRPVTLTGVEQLAKLTFILIHNGTMDISFAARKIRADMSLITKTFLQLPEAPLSRVHSTYLAPYYSSTAVTSLLTELTDLANAVAEANATDETAKRIIGNIESWADGIYEAEKELFLLALEKKSAFTFDVIHWIAHITKLFLAVSNASACSEHDRYELRRSALGLISVLSWVPDDKEAIAFVENYVMTETLFDSAADAFNRECDEVGEEVRNMLVSWAFKAGKYETGSAIFERSVYGLVTLEVRREIDGSALLAEISDRLATEDAPGQSIRDRTARKIRERAVSYHQRPYPLSRIEYQMGRVNQEKLRELLLEIANCLSPGTASEPIRARAF